MSKLTEGCIQANKKNIGIKCRCKYRKFLLFYCAGLPPPPPPRRYIWLGSEIKRHHFKLQRSYLTGDIPERICSTIMGNDRKGWY